ncbi:MAG: PAS domain-containing protein, partial [Desulfomonilaceae bacterium]
MMTETTENERSAEALKDSEEKLRAVIYGSPIPQFMIDQNHRVIHWNHALEAISGIKAETVIGTDQHWMAFYKDPRPCMADLMVDGESDLVPVWYAGKYRKSELIPDAYEATDFFPTLGNDGKWLSFTVAAIRDSEGNVIGAVETLQDITQQKRAEEALLKSKEELEERVKERTSKLLDAYEKMESDLEERVRMENLLRKSEVKFRTVANYPYDWEYWIAPDGSFKYISPSCERITGYAPDEFIDNPGLLSAITHPEDKLNVGSLLDMPDSRGPFSVDFRIITKNGDVRWIAHVCQPVFGDDGQLLGRRSSNREITERKLQEEALIRLSTAVEQAGEGILITDTQGIIQYANP